MYLPTPTPIKTNFYKSLDIDDDDDDATVVVSKCSKKMAQIRPTIHPLLTRHTAWNTMKKADPSIQIALNTAIADAGATAHFLLPGAPVTNVQPTQHPLTINLPDGGTIKSTHTCLLDMPWLPFTARIAHIVPGLAHTSLVLISTLCDAGCKVK